MAHELHSFFNGTTVAHAESKKKNNQNTFDNTTCATISVKAELVCC